MAKNFLKALPELIDAGIISSEKGREIHDYFDNKPDKSQGRLIIVFSILGSILVGLGVVLIIAHNWDDLSRPAKTLLGFLPLIIGQAICIYTILKRNDQLAWREGASIFLFFAVGSSISLVSQIYHIPGNLSSFLLTWMLLCLPMVYLLKSRITALLVIIGITVYACENSYWSRGDHQSYGYWIVMLLLLPHYYLLYRENSKSNFFIILSWLIPLSLTICLGTFSENADAFMYIAYFSWFALLLMLSNTILSDNKNFINNPFLAIGSLGTLILLLVLSFDWFWNDLLQYNGPVLSTELYVSLTLTLASTILLLYRIKNHSWRSIRFMDICYLLFIVVFLVGFNSSISAIVIINLIVLFIGILTLRHSAMQNNLGILNFGLLIITVLIMCRFFDTDISFIARGIMFVVVGASFFIGNYLLLQKRNR